MAFAKLGKIPEAEREQTAARETVAKISPEAKFDPLNKALDVLKVPENLLAGEIARSRNDLPSAITSFTAAVAAEDALNYSEPPPWYPPVRSILGAVLLANKQPADAENTFRTDLNHNPRNA